METKKNVPTRPPHFQDNRTPEQKRRAERHARQLGLQKGELLGPSGLPKLSRTSR